MVAAAQMRGDGDFWDRGWVIPSCAQGMYQLFYAQELPLVVLKEIYGMPGIEQGSGTCKAIAQLHELSFSLLSPLSLQPSMRS